LARKYDVAGELEFETLLAKLEELADREDLLTAEQRLEDIYAGHTKTIPIEDVIKWLHLEEDDMRINEIPEYLNVSNLPEEEQEPFLKWLRYGYGNYLQTDYDVWKANPDKIRRECGKGWFNIIDECEKELAVLGVGNKHWRQIKEKFGGLRLHFNYDCLSEEAAKKASVIVEKYIRISFTVCERCGNEGQLMSNDGWLSTICQDCNIKLFKGKYQPRSK